MIYKPEVGGLQPAKQESIPTKEEKRVEEMHAIGDHLSYRRVEAGNTVERLKTRSTGKKERREADKAEESLRLMEDAMRKLKNGKGKVEKGVLQILDQPTKQEDFLHRQREEKGIRLSQAEEAVDKAKGEAKRMTSGQREKIG